MSLLLIMIQQQRRRQSWVFTSHDSCLSSVSVTVSSASVRLHKSIDYRSDLTPPASSLVRAPPSVTWQPVLPEDASLPWPAPQRLATPTSGSGGNLELAEQHVVTCEVFISNFNTNRCWVFLFCFITLGSVTCGRWIWARLIQMLETVFFRHL